MDINQEFPSNYLRATDLQGKTLLCIIGRVERGEESIQGKPVMYFDGKEKGMVLNKTNAMLLAEVYGPETNGWIGKEVQLYVEKVQFKGELVDAIRVRPHQEVNTADDIPF